MSSSPEYRPIPVVDYLKGELASRVKREYVDGRVYAMAGAKNVHNRLASRALVMLGNQLQAPCEVYNSDTKVRIQENRRTYFYYPDAMVVCQPNADGETFQDAPSILVEVLSESTRRVDEGEKRENYLTIASLESYVILEQDRRQARVFQRIDAQNFRESVYSDEDSEIPLPSIHAILRFEDLYRNIEFPKTDAEVDSSCP